MAIVDLGRLGPKHAEQLRRYLNDQEQMERAYKAMFTASAWDMGLGPDRSVYAWYCPRCGASGHDEGVHRCPGPGQAAKAIGEPEVLPPDTRGLQATGDDLAAMRAGAIDIEVAE